MSRIATVFDELRRQNPAITHGHADIHCSVDHMLIGHDVTIRRDDHTASQTMLDSGLLLRHLELMTELAMLLSGGRDGGLYMMIGRKRIK